MRKALRNAAILTALALAAPLSSQAQSVFTDTFTFSTLNSASPAAPTAFSTDYAVLSSKNATASAIAPGSLDLTIPATSAGFAEMQAVFSPALITLSAGDYITMTMTFQSTHALDLSDGNTQTINVGLFNSGGTTPVPGGAMANGGMGTSTAFPTGYAQNWQGYVGRVGNLNGGNSSQIYTRDPQVGTTDQNQDLLFNNSGTGAYDLPTGTQVVGGGAQINLTDATDYTLTFMISYDGSAVTTAENIYQGIGTGGANVYSLSGQDSSATYTSFDGLAFGGRFRNSSGEAIHLTLSSLDVASSVVPEPGSMAIVLAGMGLLGMMRRFRRH